MSQNNSQIGGTLLPRCYRVLADPIKRGLYCCQRWVVPGELVQEVYHPAYPGSKILLRCRCGHNFCWDAAYLEEASAHQWLALQLDNPEACNEPA